MIFDIGYLVMSLEEVFLLLFTHHVDEEVSVHHNLWPPK